jgi:hypothetical protein
MHTAVLACHCPDGCCLERHQEWGVAVDIGRQSMRNRGGGVKLFNYGWERVNGCLIYVALAPQVGTPSWPQGGGGEPRLTQICEFFHTKNSGQYPRVPSVPVAPGPGGRGIPEKDNIYFVLLRILRTFITEITVPLYEFLLFRKILCKISPANPTFVEISQNRQLFILEIAEYCVRFFYYYFRIQQKINSP